MIEPPTARRRRIDPAAMFATGVVAAALSIVVPTARAADEVVIPGGIEHISKLLEGVAATDDLFLDRVNRRLLGVVRADGSWEGSAERAVLHAYLLVMQDLDAGFDPPVEIAPVAGVVPPQFARLAGILGYGVSAAGADIVVAPVNDLPGAESRREVARGVGWNVHYMAARLSSGEPVRMTWSRDVVPSPLPFDAWSRWTGGEPTPDTALQAFIEDQRLGLMLEASRRLGRETREALGEEFLRWAYRQAPILLFRYAAAIEFRGGRLVVPGGSGAVRFWEGLVGTSPVDDPERFVRNLLTAGDGVWIHAWWSASFLPDDQAARLMTLYENAVPDFLADFHAVMREIAGGTYFERPRSGRPGLDALSRRLALAEDHATPGRPECREWFHADRDPTVPDPDRVERVAASAADGPDQAACIGRMVLDRIEYRGWSALRGDRLGTIVRLFEDRPELATPSNVFLVGRTQVGPRAALLPIPRFDLEQPETLRDYLLAVHRMSEFAAGRPGLALELNFQGGVEWLASMADARKVPPAVVEGLLQRWSRIHLEAPDVRSIAAAEGAWLLDLAAALPTRPDRLPGRGPQERALLSAVAWPTSEEPFAWRGVDYAAEGEADLARRYLDVLVTQDVPVFDDLLAFAFAARDLEAAAANLDPEAAREASERIAAVLPRLPAPIFQTGAEVEPASPIQGVERRERIREVLDDIAHVDGPGRLRRLRPQVAALNAAVAIEARSFLTVAPYLAPLSGLDSLPIRQPFLARRHRTFDVFSGRARGGEEIEDAWHRAAIVPSGRSEHGVHVSGSLFAVRDVLAHAHVRFLGHGDQAVDLADPVLDVAYRERVSAAWSDVTPDVTAFVAAAIDAGEAWILAASSADAPEGLLARVREEIPTARLEALARGEDRQGGRPTPSERFGVAIRILESDEGGRWMEMLPAAVGDRLAERRETLGEDWKRRLGAVGIPTPAIDGRRFRHAGPWPAYEALERDEAGVELAERMWLDVRLTVVRFIGARSLPATLGRDLLDGILDTMPKTLTRANRWDWESFAEWLHGIDDAVLEEKTRECLMNGPYVLRRS